MQSQLNQPLKSLSIHRFLTNAEPTIAQASQLADLLSFGPFYKSSAFRESCICQRGPFSSLRTGFLLGVMHSGLNSG
jgi:hypothetical protein